MKYQQDELENYANCQFPILEVTLPRAYSKLCVR
jgi:hypothetical protein